MARRKRPILLLEILIAMALIAMFAIPLVREPFSMYQIRQKAAVETLVKRDADTAFYHTLATLHMGVFPSKEKQVWQKEKTSLPLLKNHTFEREILFQKPKTEKLKKHQLLTVVIKYRKTGSKKVLYEHQYKVHLTQPVESI